MKKAIFILTIALLNISNVLAQEITNEDDLKKFYIEYSSSMFSKEVEIDSIVKSYCTDNLYVAWNEDFNEIGLYDPLTNGLYEDSDLMRNSLVVKKEDDHYAVSFDYSTWDNKTKTTTVIIYVNAEGKISHTKRPEDGYLTPSK